MFIDGCRTVYSEYLGSPFTDCFRVGLEEGNVIEGFVRDEARHGCDEGAALLYEILWYIVATDR